MGSIKTTCAYCGVGCGITAKVTGARSVDIAGDKDHPANHGALCSKGTHLGETVGLEKLQVVQADLATLKPAGRNSFEMTAGDSRLPIENPVLLPGHYESSGVSAIQTMMEIVAATKAATGNANMIR